MAKELKQLTKRSENYSQWYNDLVMKADLAETAPVRGCMIIKPYGYAIWEKIQGELDKEFKKLGVKNAYFPLLIPKSFFAREAEHVKGFAKESAVVTHYRLKASDDGKDIIVDPEAKLDEELIIRPTSETMIWHTYKNWIHSYRRPATALQPVVQRHALGDAHTTFPPHIGVPVAGGTYCTFHGRGS